MTFSDLDLKAEDSRLQTQFSEIAEKLESSNFNSGRSSKLEKFYSLKSYLSELIKSDPMKDVSEKDREFIVQ